MLPILFKSSFFTLYSYPFLMGISWVFAYRLTRFLLENRTDLLVSKNQQLKYTMCFIGLVLSSFIGAKLAFLLFSSGQLLDSYSRQLSFWLGGGFVFYGGMFGAGLWTYFFIPKTWHRYFIPAAAISHSIGRVGCFLAGCCYGHDHFPIQLIESLGLAIIGVWSLRNLKHINLVSIYLISYSLFRFILEFFRADEIRGKFAELFSTSQMISIFIFVLAFGRVVYQRIKLRL